MRPKSASEISTNCPSAETFIRSFTRTRCGDVYSPVLIPAALVIEASVDAVEPLPLVPAMSTDANFCCGSPSALSSARMCSSENFLRTGAGAPATDRVVCISGPNAANRSSASSYVITSISLAFLCRRRPPRRFAPPCRAAAAHPSARPGTAPSSRCCRGLLPHACRATPTLRPIAPA